MRAIRVERAGPQVVLPLLFWLVAHGCGGAESPDAGPRVDGGAPDLGPVVCVTDDDCPDDGLFCTGPARCAPEDATADDQGCAFGPPPCATGEMCVEASERCVRCTVGGPDDRDGDGSCARDAGGDDCDDDDPNAFPGNAEVCDAEGRDEDCDPNTVGGRDLDRDGAVWDGCCNPRVDGSLFCGVDCNDANASVRPGNSEVCDGVDNNCDGAVDEGVLLDGFVDADGDFYGDLTRAARACAGAVGFSTVGDDCDDEDRTRHAGQVDILNGENDDCDDAIDEDQSLMARLTWYRDEDGDGFGASGNSRVDLVQPDGFVLLPTDCDDLDAAINPSAAEICDGLDNDCNGRADFVTADGQTEDDDGDGRPDVLCAPAADNADCDDEDRNTFVGALERCDGLDNDCDGFVDEGAMEVDWFPDADGDGFGDEAATPLRSCVDPSDETTLFAVDGTDCADDDPAVHPGVAEVCNGIDDNCDRLTDRYESRAVIDRQCDAPAALGLCREGACDLFSCQQGRGDCDGVYTPGLNGCEEDLTAPTACGACGNLCAAVANGLPICEPGPTGLTCGAMCALEYGDCNDDLADGCERFIENDPLNCGSCDFACPSADGAAATCVMNACGYECEAGFGDCDGDPENFCEVRTAIDAMNCGGCGRPCAAVTPACVNSVCITPPFLSDGRDGDLEFAIGQDVLTLASGIYQHEEIDLSGSGKRVEITGRGVLELWARGDVTIGAGVTIDLSGEDAMGGGAVESTRGGFTAQSSSLGLSCDGVMATIGGGGGSPGGDGLLLRPDLCGAGGENGGGSGGGITQSGGGGGGFAGGGGGGILLTGRPGGGGGGADGGAGGSDTGGGGGGGGASAGYEGGDGDVRRSGTAGGAGGGGSIGTAASLDLDVASTFQTGSAGGGGAGRFSGGGGGGGGALRISSLTSITIGAGALLDVSGGNGANAISSAASGGGGSGGVIYLLAPVIRIQGTLDASGGAGGATGVVGGDGGVGRIRLSVDPGRCTLLGTTRGPTMPVICAANDAPTEVFIAAYPE